VQHNFDYASVPDLTNAKMYGLRMAQLLMVKLASTSKKHSLNNMIIVTKSSVLGT
jgi:hypothetical protein